MRRIALLAALLPFAAAAQTPPVTVAHPWARATAGASKTGAAYMTITDNGPPDHVTGASTPVAGMAAVHQTINQNGVMEMRPVEGGLPLETGKPVTLQPGGYHIMLTQLKQPLKQGQSFPLTLTFEHAAPMTVTVAVGSAGGSMAPMGAMPGMAGQPMK